MCRLLIKLYYYRYLIYTLEIVNILANFFYILLYFQFILISFPNINIYIGGAISVLRIITHLWLIRFQKLIPLFYGFNFAPIFSIIVFKSFIRYLTTLKTKLC